MRNRNYNDVITNRLYQRYFLKFLKTDYMSFFSVICVVLFLFSGTRALAGESIPVNERLVNIALHGAQFEQALDSIAQELDVGILLAGERPQGKRDVILKEVRFDKALSTLMSMYGVVNHATSFDLARGNVSIVVLRTDHARQGLHVAQANPAEVLKTGGGVSNGVNGIPNNDHGNGSSESSLMQAFSENIEIEAQEYIERVSSERETQRSSQSAPPDLSDEDLKALNEALMGISR